VSGAATALPRPPRLPGRPPPALALALLASALAAAMLAAVASGAFQLSPAQVLAIALRPLADLGVAYSEQQQAVLWGIRLPRVLFGACVGAALALAGALLQGLFRNPLADPTLIGISSGAALGAAAAIVLGVSWMPVAFAALRGYALPLAAFAAGFATTLLVYRLGQSDGRTSLGVMLLAGIAVTAMAFAGIGGMQFIANDEQLRNLTFWSLGSLGGASWHVVAVSGTVVVVAGTAMLRLAPALNALALGEAEAGHLGVDVQRLKRAAVLLAALVVGATVAFTGIISFIGLMAPHFVRLACGPDHRVVLPGSALAGALIAVLADTLARTLAAPAELPMGVVCALLGGPFFLVLLYRQRHTWRL